MTKNNNLHRARRERNDEFYTLYQDIERELKHYSNAFGGKIVYCNCDDARHSNFTKYFVNNFDSLGLKKLICTCYNANGNGMVFFYDGHTSHLETLQHNGDFRSEECISYLKECDVVVTNPPFSLFREYVAQLMEYNKKFLIIGNTNGITYKEIFPYIKNNELWLGCSSFNSGMYFKVPNDYEYANTYKFDRERNGSKVMRVSSICWYTNIDHNKRNQPLDLYKSYNEIDFPKYDNYDAIEVSKVADIPMNYDGVMGVPITFLDKYCPSQFEIVGITENADYLKSIYIPNQPKYDRPYINGKRIYSRLLIKMRK